MKNTIYILVLFALSAISCQQLIFGEDLESTNANENFEYLWQECNEKYTFFDLKNIDWDSVKQAYQPRINEQMSDEELFDVLADMLRELKDGHVNLIADFNTSVFPIFQAGPDIFDFRIIQDHYLPQNYFRSSGIAHDFIADEQIGYIRYSSFSIPISDKNMGFILERYQSTKGLIIDMRENGGGSVASLYNLLSYFVNEEKLVARSRIKTGPGKEDFSPSEDILVQPNEEITYSNPVMVLVDRGSFSATSFFALASKALPNLTLVGDFTGGGLGAPNGGQLPNGWTYRFSITQTLDLDGNNYENGVPPDIEVFFDWEDRTTDEVIERAIMEIL